jgi:hypothetical protein
LERQTQRRRHQGVVGGGRDGLAQRRSERHVDRLAGLL